MTAASKKDASPHRDGHDVIILARHGKPALSRKVYLTAKQYRLWWERYDESGLAEGQKAPKRLKRIARAADHVLSSHLRRAIETATLARGQAPDAQDALYAEAALPSPPLGPLKFRPKTWGVFSRMVWILGYSDGFETVTEARKRAGAAATSLESYAGGGKLVLLTAHGWFNRMIGTQLSRRGWRCVKNQGDLHWKFRRYERKTRS